jgi:hypothetical protein
MEGSCSTGQSPQRAVVTVEEEKEHDMRKLLEIYMHSCILVNEDAVVIASWDLFHMGVCVYV